MSFGLETLGSIIGNIAGSGDRKKADALKQSALDNISGLKLPQLEQLKIQMEELRSQGELTPEMEATITQQMSEMGNVSTDPRLKDAQMAALTKMMGMSEGGLSAQDRLRLNDTRRTIAGDTHAADEQILQQMAQRGAGGSGAELAARIMSSQGQADRAARAGDEIAAQANAQALQAMMNSGTMGGQIREQDFGEQARKAEAADAVNRFNAANQQQVVSRNTSARNDAQGANLTSKQRIADANVGTHNYQDQYNKNLIVDNYNREREKADMLSKAQQGRAADFTAASDRKKAMGAGIGKGVGEVATAIATGGASAALPSGGASLEDMNKPEYGWGGSK